MLEWRDHPPLKLTMLERPASVAPSSTDSRGLTTVDGGDTLDTAVSESSCKYGCCSGFFSATSCVAETAVVTLSCGTWPVSVVPSRAK